MGDDAEAVLGDDPLVIGTDRGILDQREAGAVGAIGELPFVAAGEAVAHQRQGPGLVGVGIGVDEGVDAGGGDVAIGLLAFRPVVGVAGEAGDGEVEPEAGIVVGDGQRFPEEARGVGVVPGIVGGGTLVAEGLVGAVGGRRKAALDGAGELAGLVDIAAGNEVELGEAVASRLGVSSAVWTSRPAIAPTEAARMPKSVLRKHQRALVL